MMLSGKSARTACFPAGVSIQPLGNKKPLSVGPAYRGLLSLGLSSANTSELRRTDVRTVTGTSRVNMARAPGDEEDNKVLWCELNGHGKIFLWTSPPGRNSPSGD